jgi:dCTP deaminase
VTLLADHQILNAIQDGDIAIDPFDMSMLQPASVDLHLGYELKIYKPGPPIDPLVGVTEDDFTVIDLNEVGYWSLKPGEGALGCTIQTVKLSARVKASFDGRSTTGRWLLAQHVTAGFFDPGYEGQPTVEIVNFNSVRTIWLRPGMGIAQMSFHRLGMGAKRPYGHPGLRSKYQGQMGATIPGTVRTLALAEES